MKTNIVDNTCTIHGVALEISGYGVLITGQSGIGKSDLLIELISRKHKFLADDLVKIKLNGLKATLIREEEPFIHIRNVGFIDVAKIYGADCIVNNLAFDIMVELTNSNINEKSDPLQAPYFITKFGEVGIKTYILNVAQHRPLSLLIELLVQYQRDVENGYDSHQEFLRNHKKVMDKVKVCN